jgi:DNA-binding XRE family transcriptional regulator
MTRREPPPRPKAPTVGPGLLTSTSIPPPVVTSPHHHPGPAPGPAPASFLPSLSMQPTDWNTWMRRLASQLRRLRRFLGLSQGELARRAGVSQGAVSRLETGRARMTPLVVVLKIGVVLRQSMAVFDRDVPSDELRAALDGLDRLVPFARQADACPGPITTDTKLVDLVRLFRAAPDGERRIVLAILRAVAR